METLHSAEQKNNLELYLNDVYEKECVFKIEQEEVEFIQTGIETLVQDLVDQILAHDSFDELISDILVEGKRGYIKIDVFMKEIYKTNLVEVYFPIQSDCSLQRYVAENTSYVKTVKSTIIKVGSFYDGTKNNFPDEFDFIFPVLGVRTYILPGLIRLIQEHVGNAIPEYGQSLYYTALSEQPQVTRELEFEKLLGRHGPALKMQFIYRNGFGEQRPIHVDLVPACRIIDCNTQQMFVNQVNDYVEPKKFRDEILSAGSCLNVIYGFAFTEIEQHFMKNILSKKHVKVTRILKCLLNGNGDGEKLNEYSKKRSKYHYTSYRIKILMIYHHEDCTNSDTEDLGPCVLQVLKEMSRYEYEDKFPRFSRPVPIPVLRVTISKITVTILQSMKTSEVIYNYERDKIKSISRQYLDSVTLIKKS